MVSMGECSFRVFMSVSLKWWPFFFRCTLVPEVHGVVPSVGRVGQKVSKALHSHHCQDRHPANDIELTCRERYPFSRLFPTDSQKVRALGIHITGNVILLSRTQFSLSLPLPFSKSNFILSSNSYYLFIFKLEKNFHSFQKIPNSVWLGPPNPIIVVKGMLVFWWSGLSQMFPSGIRAELPQTTWNQSPCEYWGWSGTRRRKISWWRQLSTLHFGFRAVEHHQCSWNTYFMLLWYVGEERSKNHNQGPRSQEEYD